VAQPGAIKSYLQANFYQRYQGEMTVREALTRSGNWEDCPDGTKR